MLTSWAYLSWASSQSRFFPVRARCAVEARVRFGECSSRPQGYLRALHRAGGNRACTLVIHDNNAIWRDLALLHFERRRDGAIDKQAFATAQRQRVDLEPELI